MIPQRLDVGGLRALYREGHTSPVEVAAEVLARIERYSDPAVWITRLPASNVMQRARELSERPAENLPLYGIPFAVKDNMDAVGLPTTAACPAFGYLPDVNAPVVDKLLAAGAILLGKTNLDQFATGLVGTRSPFGAPRSVFDSRYISGGSSSGSAVAVAAGLVAFALGTDTAGSGRVPAAFNNLIGFKPTRGVVSTRGVVPACRSLDCVSIFAHSAADAREVTGVVADWDPQDPFSRRAERLSFPLSGFRFGALRAADREFFGDTQNAALYDAAIARLQSLGGAPLTVDFASFREAAKLLYDGPWVAERVTTIRTLLAADPAALDPVVRAVIATGAGKTAVETFEAVHRVAELKRAADTAWTKMDVLLLPTAPTTYRIEEVEGDPVGLNARLGIYTNFVNLLDCCAVAVPAGFRPDGLPFGVSLIAPAFRDDAIAVLAGRLHHAAQCGSGAFRNADLPADDAPPPDERVSLFVVGAHLSGMVLNRELIELGAEFQRAVTTRADYRLFVLPNSSPAKPGLIRSPGGRGAAIAGEIWKLSPAAFGRFVARIPAPLGIGKIRLEDETDVSGFLCEAFAVAGAEEITQLGGWRNYCRSVA